MIFVRKLTQRSLVALGAFLLAACTAKEVVVGGNDFPSPVLEKMPLTVGIAYPPAFAQHEFFDEAKGRAESDWLVKTGDAQVKFWNTMLGGMFEQTVRIDSDATLHEWEDKLDIVLVPTIEDLQYTIPLHTNVKVYEIWMRYRFRLVKPSDIHEHTDGSLTYHPEEHIADWSFTGYGKTPTAFLQSDEEAVNLAARVALRDAGANFATTFAGVPEVSAWLNARQVGGNAD
jgi:hypothetical protein